MGAMPERAESRMTVASTGAAPLSAALEIQVLGPLEVRRNGASVAVGGPKQRSILAMLIANQGRPVSLDRIVDDLYDDDSSGGARRSVQTFISLIRKEAGDIIAKDRGGYVLAVDAAAVDAFRFEEQVRAALDMSNDDPEAAAGALREALSMWRGLPYADVEARSAFDAEITRLGELRL